MRLKYATAQNKFHRQFYKANRAFVRKQTAIRFARAVKSLEKLGYRVVVWDAYRPTSVQRNLYKLHPDARYVGQPGRSSQHDRGIAIDVSLADKNGRELKMPTGFDSFSPQAHSNYSKLSPDIKKRRDRLKKAMLKVGFRQMSTEWWHFWDPSGQREKTVNTPVERLADRSDKIKSKKL